MVLLPLISLDKKLPIEMKSMLESSRTEEAVPYHTVQRYKYKRNLSLRGSSLLTELTD